MAMEKHLFNLKFAAKQLERDSKKCDKEEKVEKNKLKKAIEKGNMEVARIHAENGKFKRFFAYKISLNFIIFYFIIQMKILNFHIRSNIIYL